MACIVLQLKYIVNGVIIVCRSSDKTAFKATDIAAMSSLMYFLPVFLAPNKKMFIFMSLYVNIPVTPLVLGVVMFNVREI
jgi:hypothetical protein